MEERESAIQSLGLWRARERFRIFAFAIVALFPNFLNLLFWIVNRVSE